MQKLGLGTANFGMDYGIANHGGQIRFEQIRRILNFAEDISLSTVDTAEAYGSSEAVLGQVGVKNFDVITKTGRVSGPNYKSELEKIIDTAKTRLKVDKLGGLLLHSPDQLIEEDGEKLALALNGIRDLGLVQRIGISIYDPKILDNLKKFFKPDIVQAPFNIFDQRIKSSGWAYRLKQSGTEIHLRSAFLQGLLTMEQDELPIKFNQWSKIFCKWFEFQATTQLSAVEIALGFCLSQDWAKKIIVGVENVNQLKELNRVAQLKTRLPDIFCAGIEDEMLIDPSNWSKL